MSESNLKAAVGQVLSTFPVNGSGVRVQAELHHGVLNTGKNGRKKSLDFALACLPDNGHCNNVEFAIETKWADSSHCKPNAIAEDLIRLSLVKKVNPQAVCIFLLAGTVGSIQRKIKNYPFYEKDVRNNGIHLSSNERKCSLNGLDKFHKNPFLQSINEWGNHSKLPTAIVTRCHGPHPKPNNEKTIKFQAIAWEVIKVIE